MTTMNSFVRLGFVPRNYDLGLLVLRVVFGFTLCIAHGWTKAVHFSGMASHFPDPLHIGARFTLMFAILSDLICSLLVVIGLGTRWAALIIAINTGAAFVLVHKFALFGPHSGELPLLFCFWAVAILIAGPGRYSVDGA
jgi:putative oxidoreductase